MSTKRRPKWAQGKEWDGWGTKPDVLAETVMRVGDNGMYKFYMQIDESGELHVTHILLADIQFHTATSALRVANVIAEELGGWAELDKNAP